MEVIRTIAALRSKLQQLRAEKNANHQVGHVGFVPTMGYLHQGHLSLLKHARKDNDIVVLSIFVNPLQFGKNEDFSTYPRDEKRDLSLAEQVDVDIVFIPNVEEIYPQRPKTIISVTELTERLCGSVRPGHFDGVATVVMKLFHIVQADRAYFGLKDAQQVAVIEQMVRDLNMDIEIIPCPILREADGLAMSSRNVYLTSEERSQAVVLSQALQQVNQQILDKLDPDLTVGRVVNIMNELISAKTLADIDYIEILSYPTLETFSSDELVQPLLTKQSIIIALAVKFGRTRLIDNMIIAQKNVEVI